jgi:hypothetical protein
MLKMSLISRSIQETAWIRGSRNCDELRAKGFARTPRPPLLLLQALKLHQPSQSSVIADNVDTCIDAIQFRSAVAAAISLSTVTLAGVFFRHSPFLADPQAA